MLMLRVPRMNLKAAQDTIQEAGIFPSATASMREATGAGRCPTATHRGGTRPSRVARRFAIPPNQARSRGRIRWAMRLNRPEEEP
ncbi:hypothetical protein EGT50_09245 [Rhodococcus xishaensis]|uniref:Uncharacterized protein n=1 Tax=Rhodococcus xishaensis TaxID=2487364 RepID=A0A3S3E118_9NOCA|nr:hypothetical protein EGT50_09245 [Rhodococcus xishaensis]